MGQASHFEPHDLEMLISAMNFLMCIAFPLLTRSIERGSQSTVHHLPDSSANPARTGFGLGTADAPTTPRLREGSADQVRVDRLVEVVRGPFSAIKPGPKKTRMSIPMAGLTINDSTGTRI